MTTHHPNGHSKVSNFWSKDLLHRKDLVLSGKTVVASMRQFKNGKMLDGVLISWALAQQKYVRIDRKTEWRNPFTSPDDGDHDSVCKLFAEKYWPYKRKLHQKCNHLRGKVLVCWCYPLRCHGDFIAEYVNSHKDELSNNLRAETHDYWWAR